MDKLRKDMEKTTQETVDLNTGPKDKEDRIESMMDELMKKESMMDEEYEEEEEEDDDYERFSDDNAICEDEDEEVDTFKV